MHKQINIYSNFSSIVRSGRYVNMWIDAKCLVATKCLPTEKNLSSAKSLLSTKNLPSAKSLSTTKSLAVTTILVIDKHLMDENLSNVTQMSSSNNFCHWKFLK